MTHDDPLIVEEPGKGSSIPASVSVLANTILGVALLGLPWCFSADGLLVGVTLLVTCAILSCFGLHLLSAVASRAHALEPRNELTYYSLNRLLFPKARYALDIIILIKSLGVAISYLLVIGDTFPDLSRQFSITASVARRMSPTTLRTVSIIFAMVFFVVPASLPKKIRSMRFTNWFSVVCVVYVAAMSVVLSALNTGAIPEKSQGPSGEAMPSLLPHGSPLKILTTVPVFIFAFTCHQNALSVAYELKNRTLRKLDVIIVSSVCISFILYGATAVAGYFQFGTNIEPDLLNSYDSSWTVIRLGKLFVTMSVIFSFPMQCHPFRRSFRVLCSRGLELSDSQENRIFNRSTVIFFICTAGIAISVSNLGMVFELIGALCSNTLCYIAPPSLYLKMFPASECRPIVRVAAWGLLALGFMILPLSLTAIIVTSRA